MLTRFPPPNKKIEIALNWWHFCVENSGHVAKNNFGRWWQGRAQLKQPFSSHPALLIHGIFLFGKLKMTQLSEGRSLEDITRNLVSPCLALSLEIHPPTVDSIYLLLPQKSSQTGKQKRKKSAVASSNGWEQRLMWQISRVRTQTYNFFRWLSIFSRYKRRKHWKIGLWTHVERSNSRCLELWHLRPKHAEEPKALQIAAPKWKCDWENSHE